MYDYYMLDWVVILVVGNIFDSFIKDVEKWFGLYEVKGKVIGFEKLEFYMEKLMRKKEIE